MSELFVHDRGCRIVVDGVNATFRPGKPRPLRPMLREAAAGAGVRPYEGGDASATPASLEALEPAKASERPSLETIAEAIQTIKARGKKGDVTTNGDVRMNVLEAELGVDISAEERDAAAELIEE